MIWGWQNENKELQTFQKRNSVAWDEKYAALLSKLEWYQEEKDTPRKQVVDMEIDELWVAQIILAFFLC